MVKAKFFTKDKGIVEIEVAKVLVDINNICPMNELQAMKWWKDEGKIDFLQGRISPLLINCPIEPLSDEDCKKAIEEYNNLLGY